MEHNLRDVVLFTLALALLLASPIQAQPENPTWVRTGGPPGGLGYDIRYNFANPNVWHVTDSYAGAFISTDSGRTWLPSSDGIPPQAGPSGDAIPVFSLTVDPHDPDIIWAGTNPTGHIYRSIDGGRSWEQRDNGVTMDYGGGLSFRGFTVDPRSSDIVYAMGETADPLTGFAVWGSGTGGVIFKTADGGAHWAKIWDGGMPSSLARYLCVNPDNPELLYVSTGIFDRGAIGEGDPATDPFGGLGILRSTDGGRTWEYLNEANGLESLYIGSLYMHPEDPSILLAAAGHLMPVAYAELLMQGGHSPQGVYRTTDGGDTWTHVLEPPPGRPDETFTSVELCPSDPNVGYAGSGHAIYRTTDGGLTWASVAGGDTDWGPPGVVAGWPIDMQCDPRNPDRVFANNYNGGNFLSEDGGHTWISASRGYTGAQSRQVAVDPFNPKRVYAVARSGIWRSENRGADWTGTFHVQAGLDPPPAGLEWQVVAMDPSQRDHVLGGHGMLLETVDGGANWVPRWVHQGGGQGPTVITIVFAPSHPRTVYAGLGPDGCALGHEPSADECPCPGAGVIVSQDGGESWAYAVDANTRDLTALDIAVDPSDARVVYMASGAGLFKTTNGGLTWTECLSHPQWVRAVAVSPHDPQHILAGVERAGVFVSLDGGDTWQQSVSGLTATNSLHDIAFDSLDPRLVFVSDYFSGVYRSQDGGQTWEEINNGLRTRSVLGMSVSPDGTALYVATNGEGVYRLKLREEPGPIDGSSLWASTPWPNPTNGGSTLSYRGSPGVTLDVRILGVDGAIVRTLSGECSGELQEIEWDGLSADGVPLPAGVYYLQLVSAGRVRTSRLVVVR
jgi:photosystem II stability/assembly factor-like uncharacterized protein